MYEVDDHTNKKQRRCKMPNIRPMSDLSDNATEISDFCKLANEPVFITRNGASDMVVMSVEMYERREAQIDLYAKLAEAEAEAAHDTGADFAEFAEKLRSGVHGAV
jgi:PHD/YefM family antitoxin component YafN of YafNO toxin-antitoxin module